MQWMSDDEWQTRVVIAAHHPDRLSWPAARPGTIARDRFVQTLQWNVFRTLELLPPAFWLRRLHARLTREVRPTAPQTVAVQLWPMLPLPPAQRVDTPCRFASLDVLVETEHAVWVFVDGGGTNADDPVGVASTALADVIHAARWRAGTRECCVGVLHLGYEGRAQPDTITERYTRSPYSLALRSTATIRSGVPRPPIGVVSWSEVAAVIVDVSDAEALSPIERALARNALDWLMRVGIHPVTSEFTL